MPVYGVLAFGYEFLSEFVPFFLVWMLFRRKQGALSASVFKRESVLPVVFALYLMAVFAVTNPGTVYDAMRLQTGHLLERVNLKPFSREIDVVGYLLNLVLFLPLGFLVPLIWKRMATLPRVAGTGFAFSALIELSQLLSSRGTDVDDLIVNTLGAAAGFLLYSVWDRITKSRYQTAGCDPLELPALILAVYLGRFLLFYRLGLIRLIYGA